MRDALFFVPQDLVSSYRKLNHENLNGLVTDKLKRTR